MIKIFMKFSKKFREFSRILGIDSRKKIYSENFQEFSRIFAKILGILKGKKIIFEKKFFLFKKEGV